MTENLFLELTPSGMEWLIVLAYLAILGLVGDMVVWRIVRADKILRSKANWKEESFDGRPGENKDDFGCSNLC